MFSQLGPIFKTVFRQTEASDARLEIRREEKEDGRKKKDLEEEDDGSDSLWVDSTGVSIESLRTFLIEFLKKQGAPSPDIATELDLSAVHAPIEVREPVSTIAARAVKAYGTMTAQIQPQTIPEPPLPQSPENPADILDSEDIRAIHALIKDLDLLSKQGVQTLTFQMNGTFLESVIEAVRLSKNPL